MIPKKQKLTRGTFPKHTDPKKIWVGVCLRIHTTKTPALHSPRFAVIVSKKTEARATKRNALKRSVYDATRRLSVSTPRTHGLKIVITVQKKEHVLITKSLIEKDIIQFDQSGIL